MTQPVPRVLFVTAFAVTSGAFLLLRCLIYKVHAFSAECYCSTAAFICQPLFSPDPSEVPRLIRPLSDSFVRLPNSSPFVKPLRESFFTFFNGRYFADLSCPGSRKKGCANSAPSAIMLPRSHFIHFSDSFIIGGEPSADPSYVGRLWEASGADAGAGGRLEYSASP